MKLLEPVEAILIPAGVGAYLAALCAATTPWQGWAVLASALCVCLGLAWQCSRTRNHRGMTWCLLIAALIVIFAGMALCGFAIPSDR